ncbi:integral membrane protein [Talaromyces pinophilus]|uniref:Integral membrane protein n=1 Tax=Talaromyces pinophilus TaxID=128442 RepID=A0A478EBF4_TALPI|nr:integral membrane protein [Talaromyces pinophilus]
MGWVYNLETPNAPTNAPRLIAIVSVFSIAALLAVLLRFYARFFTNRKPWVDDYTALVSVVLLIVYSGLAIGQTRWGQGLDPAAFPPEDIIPFGKIQYAGGPIYTLALLGFKLALLTSYLRIAGFVQFYKKVLYGLVILCICNSITFTLLICLTCIPVAKIWDSTVPGHCINAIAAYYAIAGSSLALDVLIIILPIPVLLKLKLNSKQKLVLVGMFATGFFVTVIQIIRIFTIKNLQSYTDSAAIIIWSAIEISLGIIVPCIPTWAPLVRSMAIASGLGSSSGPSRPWQSHNTPQRSALRNGGGTRGGGGKRDKFSAIGSADMSYDMNAFATVTTHHIDHGDRSSEEAIIQREVTDAAPQHADDASREDRFQIRTTTTVKVESHKLDDDNESDLSRRL